MGFFGFLGSMIMGILFFGVFIVILIVSFFVSSFQKRRDSRRNNYANNNRGYSTGSSTDRYAYTKDNKSKWKRPGKRYNGPTAKRTYTNTNNKSSQSSNNDVVEIPILEVTDVTENSSK
ncbi:MAG: hypothetical protein ACOYIK_01280 [Coriobacteriales bacterium]|jgi:cation transport regulator ChaB